MTIKRYPGVTSLILANIISTLIIGVLSEHDVSVFWWQNPPYFYSADVQEGNITSWRDNRTLGVYQWLLQELLESCDITASNVDANVTLTRVSSSTAFFRELENGKTHFRNTTLIFVGVTSRMSEVHKQEPLLALEASRLLERQATFMPVLDLPGAVHFYKREDEPVGSDLLTVIIQGWPLLILILLGAGYSGIIIWLLDRLWNPTNFPKPFIRGFWEGFWWAFVTMTTVGYGDTTPRSIQARIYGLIWIVVGITILSVFTATVTTVLTQESLGASQSIHGLQIGVINGTDEFRLVVTKGGSPVVCNSFAAILDLLQSKPPGIRGALVDQYSFAAQQDMLTSPDLLIEKLVSNPLLHGLVVASPRAEVTECMRKNVVYLRERAFQLLTSLISSLTTKTTKTAESSQKLFLPRTITYLWYGLGVWVVVFIAFVVWEFAYWRPKHRKRKAEKLDKEFSLGCATKKDLYIPRLSLARQKQLLNGDTGKKSTCYINKSLSIDEHPSRHELKTTSLSQSSSSLSQSQPGPGLAEVETLEALIRLQKEEVEQMNDEMSTFRENWTQRQSELRKFHRDQRRKLLRLLGAEDRPERALSDTPVDVSTTSQPLTVQHM